jgi:CRISPR-associated protein Csc2
MAAIKELYKFIDRRWFVSDLKENSIGHIKIALVREVVNPLIIRSTDMEATITLVTADGRELVEIPPRKLKSKEKLLGLMLCREFKVVDEKVRYNVFEGAEMLNNPNSALFGDTSTKSGDTAGLTSRAIYDWAYSLRDVKDITDKLQNTAVREEGTMID